MNEAESASVEDLVPVQDLNEFVRVLTAWHTNKINIVKKLIDVPDGTTFKVDEESITLYGPTLDAFKFGLEMALMQLDPLPFVAELEDAPA